VDAMVAQAEKHWKEHLPTAYASLSDPTEFFEALAAEATTQIEDLTEALAGPTPEGEPFAQTRSRLATARRDAESQIRREVLLPPAETTTEDETTSPEDDEFQAAVTEFQTLRDSLTP